MSTQFICKKIQNAINWSDKKREFKAGTLASDKIEAFSLHCADIRFVTGYKSENHTKMIRKYFAAGLEAQIRRTGNDSRSTLIVFVHGNGLCKSTYRQTIAHLFEINKYPGALHCVSLDLPGHGTHEWAGQSLDHFTKLADFAKPIEEKVNEYCKQESFDRKILVAHSVGCHMSLFAQKNLKFDKALLIEPIIDTSPDGKPLRGMPESFVQRVRSRRSTFPSFQAAYDALRPKGIFSLWETECVKDYVFHGGFRKVAAADTEEEVELCCNPNLEANTFTKDMSEIEPMLREVQFKEVVVLAGSKSTFLPSSTFEATARKLNAEFILLPNINHVVQCEAPSVVASQVNKLLLL